MNKHISLFSLSSLCFLSFTKAGFYVVYDNMLDHYVKICSLQESVVKGSHTFGVALTVPSRKRDMGM